jgi:protein-S-isoprenylcysteine O-methyltransferase Ste14
MEHLQPLTFINLLFYFFNGLWLLEFIFFRNKSKKGTFKESYSYYVLIILIILTIVFTILFARDNLGMYHQTSFYVMSQWIGLTFFIVGLLLRYTGSIALGINFTRHVDVSSSMTLIEHGPYRFLRHPLYLGLFLITIAFPLYIGNYFVLMIFVPLLMVGMAYRMHIEEKALIKLHPSYAIWRKHRYRFIPFVF